MHSKESKFKDIKIFKNKLSNSWLLHFRIYRALGLVYTGLTCLVEAEQVGKESACHVSLSGLGVMEKSHLERQGALHAKVDLLDVLPLLPVPDVQVRRVVPLGHVSGIKPCIKTSYII